MSDPKYGDPHYGDPVGEPVEDPRPVDDVVGSAREGLADAAASRDAVSADDWDAAYAGSGSLPTRDDSADDGTADKGDAESDAAAPARTVDAAHDERIEPVAASAAREERHFDEDFTGGSAGTATAGAAAVGAAAAGGTAAASARPSDDLRPSDTATRAYAADDEATTRVSASEPVGGSTAAAPQPIFVQAPEAPNPRGNRGAAGAIGLLAAVVFALIYFGASLGLSALRGDLTAENIGAEALAAVTSFWLWVPVVVFFLSFWLLGAFINRGRWGLWVVFGLLVGIASYGGHLLGQLFEAPFWNIAPSQALTLLGEQAFVPLALVALVAGRELTIWFGAWVSARGRRVTELNAEAQREYERTLEAGPQLHRY